jgi:hypothetical protein
MVIFANKWVKEVRPHLEEVITPRIQVNRWVIEERPPPPSPPPLPPEAYFEEVITPRIRVSKWIREKIKKIVAAPIPEVVKPVEVVEVETPVAAPKKPKRQQKQKRKAPKSDYFGHMAMSEKHLKASYSVDSTTKKHRKCTYIKEFIET